MNKLFKFFKQLNTPQAAKPSQAPKALQAPQAEPEKPAEPVAVTKDLPQNKTETIKGSAGMFLHIMLKVSNLPRSVQFYSKALGLNVLKEDDRPDAGYALAFVSFGKGNPDRHFEIQLTHLYNTQFNPQGQAFGNMTLAVMDVEKICSLVAENGGSVLREPSMRGDKMAAKVADPDGYQLEIINFA